MTRLEEQGHIEAYKLAEVVVSVVDEEQQPLANDEGVHLWARVTDGESGGGRLGAGLRTRRPRRLQLLQRHRVPQRRPRGRGPRGGGDLHGGGGPRGGGGGVRAVPGEGTVRRARQLQDQGIASQVLVLPRPEGRGAGGERARVTARFEAQDRVRRGWGRHGDAPDRTASVHFHGRTGEGGH